MLFDRPALMRQPHELRAARPSPAARRSSACGGRSGPSPRSQSSQISGASRRCRQSVAGVTRSAAKSAAHGGLVPLRHATRCHAARRQRVAERADADGLLIGPALAAIARRRLRRDRRAASGVPRKTVSVGEMPSAYGRRSRCSVWRTVRLSPYSASATTAVSVTPAARVRRTSVRASRHFS